VEGVVLVPVGRLFVNAVVNAVQYSQYVCGRCVHIFVVNAVKLPVVAVAAKLREGKSVA